MKAFVKQVTGRHQVGRPAPEKECIPILYVREATSLQSVKLPVHHFGYCHRLKCGIPHSDTK